MIDGNRLTRSRCVLRDTRETRNRLGVYTATRDEVRGSRSSHSADGGAVALMLELMSCFPDLPDRAPLTVYRFVSSARVVRYGRALRAVKEMVAETGRNPDEFALYLLRIGGATTPAAGGDISERVIQKKKKGGGRKR